MMYENDKLNIPDQYKKMSVSELRHEKDKVYEEIRQNSSVTVNEKEYKEEIIKFNF